MKKPGGNNNSAWSILIGLALLAAIVIRLPNDQMREGFVFSFRCAAVFLFAVFLMDSINIWAGLFLMLALFSHTFPIFYITGLRVVNTPESTYALDLVALGCGLYALIVAKCSKPEHVLNILCGLAALNLLFLILQRKGFDAYMLLGLASVVDTRCGFMANPNESGTFMALCASAFFRNPIFAYVSFVLVIIPGIIFSGSFGGAIGVCLAVIFCLGCYGHKFWPGALMCVATILFYKSVHKPGLNRLYAWDTATALCLKNNPLIGCGLGNWKFIYPDLVKYGVMENGWIRLHSSYVQGYVEMGVGFIAVILGYVDNIFTRMQGVARKVAMPVAGLAALAGCMISNTVFQVNALNGMVAIFWLALMEIKLREHSLKEVAV